MSQNSSDKSIASSETKATFGELLRTRYKAKTKKQKANMIFNSCILFLFCCVLFIMYGPYKKISDLYICTFMHTSDHKYFATMLYPDDYILEVLYRNGVTELTGVSDRIFTLSSSRGIEVIEIVKPTYRGWLLIVDDPTRIRFVRAKGNGELLEDIAKEHNAQAAINASGYYYKDKSLPGGFTVVDHERINGAPVGMHSFAALDDDNLFYIGRLRGDILDANNYRDVIEFGPLLLLNGEKCSVEGNGSGLAPRTAIGATADGKVLLLAINGWLAGGSAGTTHGEVQNIMLEYGAVNALNLDGGSSSSMYYEGKIINTPCNGDAERMLPNAIIVV